LVAELTVIYSNADGVEETGAGHWHQVPNAFFYGRKFRETLALFRGDIMLHLHADASTDDWASVITSVERCYAEIPDLEVWASGIDASPLPDRQVAAGRASLPGVEIVYRTDSIVWAITARCVERFRALDFDCNNLGWGLDLVAAAFAHTHRRLAVRDTNVVVKHPLTTGYDRREAARQEIVFFRQLELGEQLQLQLIRRWVDSADIPPIAHLVAECYNRLRVRGGAVKRFLGMGARRRPPFLRPAPSRD
jgi:hypothetical protein